MLYSDRRKLKQRTKRQLRKDHDTSGYPITPRPFLVMPDGVAPARGEAYASFGKWLATRDCRNLDFHHPGKG